MNNSGIMWVGRYEGLLRHVARGCSYGDATSLFSGAQVLSAFIEDGTIIVPMPSHIGYATTMKWLCERIETINEIKSIKMFDCLVCNPHESSRLVKIQNGVPPDIRMYLKKDPPKDKRILIIDNVVCTGMTARAALAALPNATVLTIAKG